MAVLSSSGVVVRDAVITPPSVRHELLAVVRAGMAIALVVWFYLAINPFASSDSAAAPRGMLMPYQAFVRDRPLDDQQMFRELQVALLEAETVRSMSGTWPTAAALLADGVEPFAVNPALKRPPYEWQDLRDGRFINYLGVSTTARAPAWLVLIQEPDPAAPEVFRADEEHHQLVDGSVLHVSIWSLPDSMRAPVKLTPAPQFEGWTQLFAVSPSSAHLLPTASQR